jgi:hypothetical protein
VPYHNNYWSDLFVQNYDPSVLEVFQLLKYFGNFITFISHGVANSQKHWSLAMATLVKIGTYINQMHFVVTARTYVDKSGTYCTISNSLSVTHHKGYLMCQNMGFVTDHRDY